MQKSKRSLAVILSIVVLIAAAAGVVIYKVMSSPKGTPHAIKPAESFNDNPLKGFVPFSRSFASFPHSLEFFYMPMSALYPDENMTPESAPDFTEFEKELDKIALRGNQAVFRIYIDYPTNDPFANPVGIPQFLRKEPYNLKTFDYGVFGNYISRIPDYSDPNLRKTIQNCIKYMGEKYDGDPRIGFITAGFLGFWGEWHCWPYNGVTHPKNYEPSKEVFNEVTSAFNEAFKKTKVVVRYPVDLDTQLSHIGYHDDSYCYETISVEYGGFDYNFIEKLKAAKVEERWKTAPIGGELRPEIQKTIFDSEPWTGAPDMPHESWDINLKLIRPSWMINESIKTYKDEVLEKAIKASRQMGYDFRVITAYYKDNIKSKDKLYLAVDIQNIGIAPFYYDHTTWPVLVGVKKGDEVVASYTTTWDLNTIAPDSDPVRFEYRAESPIGLEDGYYTICIKVQNPLPEGNPLGFANEYQYDDGWLDLGIFAVGNVEGMATPAPKPQPTHRIKERPAAEIAAESDPNTYEAEAEINILGGSAVIEGGALYSNNYKVGYIGNNDGTLQVNGITVPEDGEYIIEIYYATQEARSAEISVNGGEPIVVDFEPGLTWTQIKVHELTVQLKAGSDNTLLISNSTGWAPDFDKFVLKQKCS